MSRATILIAVFVAAACGGGASGLPAPPPHTPDNSPEPPTECKKAREAAKEARNDVLEFGGDERRKLAAGKVLAHAECERKQFDGMPLHDATEPEMLANIRAARDQYNTTANLYKEVANYNILEYVRAGARLGDLHRAYGDKLRATPAPAAMTKPTDRKSFVANLHKLAGSLDRRAANAYADVLAKVDKIGGVISADPKAKTWIPEACKHLTRLDPKSAATVQVCQAQQ